MRWAKNGRLEEQSKRYLEMYGEGRSDEFKRRAVGEGWIERYRIMFKAMRDALQGEAGNRRWLLYAHSPVEDRGGVKITIPDYKTTEVDVPRSGAFYVVDEEKNSVRPLDRS